MLTIPMIFNCFALKSLVKHICMDGGPLYIFIVMVLHNCEAVKYLDGGK
jgi:hypothetical protein